jgi:hypothetical protein
MAQKLSDDGQIATFLTDDGREVRVASQFAQPFMPTPDPALDVAPMDFADPPPEEVESFPIDDLSGPQPDPAAAPALQLPPPDDSPAEPAVAPLPATPIAPAPIVPAPYPERPIDAATPIETSIAPTGPLNTPTQIAGAVNSAQQERADSALTAAEASEAAAGQIVGGSNLLDERMAAIEADRRAEAEERKRDEAVLAERHSKLVDRYANFRVDPNRGMSSDRKAMAWIAAAIAGLGSALKGDGANNPAIAALMAGMDRNVQIQMAERDAIGNAVGMAKDKIADFRNATTTRLGEYNLRLGAEMERYAKFVERVKVRLGSVEDREAASQLVSQIRAEAAVRTGQATREEAEARARARAARAAAAAAVAKQAEDRRRFQATNKVVYDPKTDSYVADTRAVDPLERQGKALDVVGKDLDNRKKATEILNGPPVTEGSVARQKDAAGRSVNGFDGKPLMRTIKVKGPDGKEVLQQVPAMAKTTELNEKLADTAAAVSVIKEASQLLRTKIKNVGGSISALGSDDVQEVKALLNTIDLTNKNIEELGVIAGPDKDYLEGLRGAVDPMSFIKDASAGLAAMERRVDSKYNAKLKAYTDYYDSETATKQAPAEIAPAKAEKKRADERVRSIITADPSIGSDPSAIAADADQKVEDLKVFLKRDKPSVAAVDAVLAQISAAKMPSSTKAALTAQIVTYRKKAESKELQEDVADSIFPGRRQFNQPLFSESDRFNMPIPEKAK